MASLTRTIRRRIKWTKPKSKSDMVDKDVCVKVQVGVAPVCDVVNKEDLERLVNVCRSGYILTKKEEEKLNAKDE